VNKRGISRRECLGAAGAGLVAWVLAPRALGAALPSTMVAIDAGDFQRGTTPGEANILAQTFGYHTSWFGAEVPQSQVEVAAFAIDRFPVTNLEYHAFCVATGARRPRFWNGPNPPFGMLDHPVVDVNRIDAEQYAAWVGKRLPTEFEWEKAARGTQGQLFPWGNEFDPGACCWNSARAPLDMVRTAPVDAHPSGASPYGVMDMAGNAAEWCADGPSPTVGYVKGGCWATEEIVNLRPAARILSGYTINRLSYYGFRCAVSL
jgi:formylglycine-generating enzyme required for sulfatase activity